MVERIGIRDLKQQASAVIRRVASGEEFEVTDRGRPVARLVPLTRPSDYGLLVANGQVLPGVGDWRAVETGPALPGKSLSRVLLEMRDEDDR